ncbi:hypothetical protein FRC03_008568 [Tulasnella sp. 419]|nr:hypothetical protein FRC03_008568 [Tulasnella sp. 419]
MPNELLALILVGISRALDNDYERFLYPLQTSQLVSHRWRSVTLTTPSLWRTLRADNQATSDKLDAYLANSGRMSLTLEIFRLSAIPALMNHAARWARVTLWSRSIEELTEVLKKISESAISLQYFSCIMLNSSRYSPGAIDLLNPDLTTLILTNVHLAWTPPPFRFGSLTELILRDTGDELNEQELHGLLDALKATPKLKRLCCFGLCLPTDYVVLWPNHSEAPLEKVDLPDLEELVLSDFFPDEFLLLAHCIRCPRLHTLGVGMMSRTRPLHPEVDWCAFMPIHSGLKRFELWSLPDRYEELLLVLEKIPPLSLVALSGSDSSWDPDLITRSLSRLPHLQKSVQTLIIRGIGGKDVRLLLKNCFLNTRAVSIYWKDEGTIIHASANLTDSLATPPRFITWGGGDEDVWYLEGNSERKHRLESRFERF